MAVSVPDSVSLSVSAPRSLGHVSNLLFAVATLVLLGFVAPSLLGLAVLALVVTLPAAIALGLIWLAWKLIRPRHAPAQSAEPEA